MMHEDDGHFKSEDGARDDTDYQSKFYATDVLSLKSVRVHYLIIYLAHFGSIQSHIHSLGGRFAKRVLSTARKKL